MSEALQGKLCRSARAICGGLALPYRSFLRCRWQDTRSLGTWTNCSAGKEHRCSSNAAVVFHVGGPAWAKRFRQDTFQWIETRWRATVAQMEQPNHRQLATVWRAKAVAWLRCQGLIRCSTTTTVLPHSPHFLCI